MEFYLQELIDTYKKDNSIPITIDFHGETLSFTIDTIKKYSESDQRQILERFFFKCIDLISDYSLFNIIFDRLYAGDYSLLSTNVKSYLFESLELCPPKQYLPWIYKTLDNEEEMSKINVQAFTTYVDTKRKRGLTSGEIRYTIICESSSTLLELILSKVHRERLTSKQTWLAILRLKQSLSMTSLQKDMFNDWLGIF